MKVLLVNGSPKAKGCTYTALQEAAAALEKQGIETEIFQLGTQPVAGCVGCGVCEYVCPVKAVEVLPASAPGVPPTAAPTLKAPGGGA